MQYQHRRFVYFMRCDDAIKIGCSRKINQRLEQIALDIGRRPELIGFIRGSFPTERLIHKRLAQYAEGSEWFKDCAEVRALIDYLLAKGPIFHGLP